MKLRILLFKNWPAALRRPEENFWTVPANQSFCLEAACVLGMHALQLQRHLQWNWEWVCHFNVCALLLHINSHAHLTTHSLWRKREQCGNKLCINYMASHFICVCVMEICFLLQEEVNPLWCIREWEALEVRARVWEYPRHKRMFQSLRRQMWCPLYSASECQSPRPW